MNEKISTVKVIYAVGRVTFWEIVRDKVLYNIILCAFLLLAVAFLASKIMIIRQDRVVLDFGLSAVNISCAMIAGITGAAMLGREIERRTMFVALSRPISRHQFILGKFAGLSAIIFINWLLLSGAYLWVLWGSTANFGDLASPTLFVALVLLFFQSLLLLGVAILFSSFSTTSLAVIMTIGCYLIGNNISQVLLVASRTHSAIGKVVLNLGAVIVPDLEHFNLGSKVVYAIPVSASFVWFSILYALTVAAVSLLFSGVLVRFRES